MRTLIFVPYDDPCVVAFYCSNIPGDFPLVFLREEHGEGINADTIACIAMEPKESSDLSEYVTRALEIAKETSEEEKYQTIICLLPYAEFVEIIATEVSLEVPVGSFFSEHIYDSYEPGDTGVLYELRRIDGSTMNLHRLSRDEFNLLSCAN